jgi:pimeloyl-ACP methyl ester carboxylesterase
VSWRDDLEAAVGGVQLRAIERAVGAVARVRAERTPDGAIAYLDRRGSRGVPLVGIHGFGGDKETWLLVGALVDRRRGLTFIDLPGHGRSTEVPERRATIRAHAEAVLRVLDHRRIDRAVICGNSMGGGVALRIARSWPDRVAALVLVASIGRDVHDGAAREWTTGDNPLIPTPDDVDKFMTLALERPPPVGRAVIRHVVTDRARRAESLRMLFRAFVANGGDDGVPADLAAIAAPTLIVHGEQDRIIDKRTAEDLVRALPRAELVVMRGVGHAPQLEAPRHTARLIEELASRAEL